jgi:hypothetical protein
MNRAGWFLVDAISVFLGPAEVGGTGEGEWPVASLAGCMRLAAEFSIRVISYGDVVLEGAVGKGSTPWRTDTSDGES